MNDEYSLEELAPWVVGAVTLIGGLLRIFQLGWKGMWLDETFSVWLANQGVGDMLQWIVKIDQHPPLYYLLLHYWVAIYGDTPYAARLLSVLFGTATIPLMYLIGRRLSGPVMGLIAAVLLAFSPFNIFYAQETRMYTLLAFNAAVAIYALACLLTDPRAASPIGSQLRGFPQAWRTQRWSSLRTIATDLCWVALIVFSAATLLTHNTAVFFLLAANLFVLGLLLFQRLKQGGSPPALQAPTLANWVKAQIGIVLLWGLWIVVFVQQSARVYQQFWIPPPTSASIMQTLRLLLNATPQGRASQVVMLWVLAFVLCLGVVYYRKKLSILLFLVTLFAVPFVGELIVSIRRPIFYDRTLIWITIPMLLLLAAGIMQLRFRLLMILVLGAVTTNYVFTTGDYYRFFQKEDWGTAAGYVAYSAKKDDLVLFNSNFVEIPFDYYFRSYEDQYSLQIVKQGVPLDLLGDGVLEPQMTEDDVPKLASLVSGHDRVWLVYSHDSYTDPMGLIPQTLAAQKKLTSTREFYGGQVQLYETP
jgi:mannosyltransferase